jgi:hypothetical protein
MARIRLDVSMKKSDLHRVNPMRSDIADVEYIRQRGPARIRKMRPFDLLFKNQLETIWRQSVTGGRLPLSIRPSIPQVVRDHVHHYFIVAKKWQGPRWIVKCICWRRCSLEALGADKVAELFCVSG